ncbi:lipid kinase YegS [Methylobacterium oxalidis]|nr:lipid kinase YegS [Methylobacterium oxalidis]
MRISLVINAASGSAGAVPPETIRERLAASGLRIACEPDPGLPLRQRLERAAREPGIGALVVAGGDGTVACAASVLCGSETPLGRLPLGLLPLGTMNLLAKDLGPPLDLDGAVAAIGSGVVRRIDVGAVNGEVFLINSVLGMPARLAHHREAQRGRPSLAGLARWTLGLVRHLGRYPRLSVTARIDGQERRLRVRALAVVNNDYREAPGQILVRASLDGGSLTLYVLPRLSPWRLLRVGLALALALGDWRGLPGVERRAVADLTLSAPRRALRVMNDGEARLLASPLRYRILRRALLVMIPPGPEETGQREPP